MFNDRVWKNDEIDVDAKAARGTLNRAQFSIDTYRKLHTLHARR